MKLFLFPFFSSFLLRVKIMTGIDVQLVELTLIPDQELDGEMISGLFSQKTVWLLPCESLNSKIEFRVSSYQIVISTQMISESHIKLLSYQIIMTVSKYQSLRHFFQSLTLQLTGFSPLPATHFLVNYL